jgi:ABC-type glycerol-3-phosphate transport system permease component
MAGEYVRMEWWTRLALGFVALNAFAGAAALLLFPADTAAGWFWTVVPPINAGMFGALYLAAGLLVAWAALRGLWEPARFLGAMVPAFTGSAFYIFLLRQFMRGIPMELSEAAKIDGASELRTWWSIVMPLTAPALAAIAIFTFQNSWEDFMGPLLYLQREDLYTLQLGLRQFEFAAGGAPAWNWLMAASLVVMLPVIIIFLFFQRFFIEGVTLTGMGGR